jgi:hypothetical protein
MESSAQNTKTGTVKKHLNRITNSHEFMLELSIITTILVCLNFWGNLPDLGIDPIWGRGVAAVGILIIFCMIAFRFRWPLIIGLVAMVAYLGISHIQTNTTNVVKTNSTNIESVNNNK